MLASRSYGTNWLITSNFRFLKAKKFLQSCPREDEEKLIQFLLGLDNNFKTICSGIMNEDPLSSVQNTYNKIVREERVLNMINKDGKIKIGLTAFVARSTSQNIASIEKSQLLYTVCNKNGYESKTCFQVVGFPD